MQQAIDRPQHQVYWHETAKARVSSVNRTLLPDQVDVVVIGAGLTGLSLAYHIAKDSSRSVVVLEKDHIGAGASGRNGGMVTPGPADSLTALVKRYGLKRAVEIDALYGEASKYLTDLVEALDIDCEYRRVGHLRLARGSRGLNKLGELARLKINEFGHDISLLRSAALDHEMDSCGFYSGAILDKDAYSVHVGKLVAGLATAAESKGARVVEGVEVLEVSGSRGGSHCQDECRAGQRSGSNCRHQWFHRHTFPLVVQTLAAARQFHHRDCTPR